MNIKTIAATAILAILHLPMHAGAYFGASILPENVNAVYPTPDSRVDLGPNASPLGLQQISVMFNSDVTVNTSCTEKACIYLEGNDTPLQTVGITGVSGDLIQSKMGSVLFPNSCIANGRYRVTIPEGFWMLEGKGLSGAFDLNYEILVPQRIWPTEQVATELKEFRLEFPGYHEARLLDTRKIEFFRHSSTTHYPLTITVGRNEDGTLANYILISLQEPVTEQGDYSLFVQEGAAEGVIYGEASSDNPEEKEETTDVNIEANYHYTVSKLNIPAISPAEGVVESFVPFILTVPEGSEFWFVNDKAVSFIYPVEEDGTLSPDAVYRLTANKVNDSDKIVLTIVENGDPMTSVVPHPGTYALKLASGLFSGSWNGEFINSAPFVYYYNVVDTPNGVIITPAEREGQRGVFTIDGKKVQGVQNTDCMETLPEGVYIIDGQKKYIKN